MVKPHGGELIERYIGAPEAEKAACDHTHVLSERQLFDALMIGIGGFSPLKGFMGEDDYAGVVENMRLADGTLFAVPILLSVTEQKFAQMGKGQTIRLTDGSGKTVGVCEISGTFKRDLEKEALNVYGTTEKEHAGVKKIFEEGEYAVAGPVSIVLENIDTGFPENFLTPKKTREYFVSQNWDSVAAFQTRNPIHRAHEYLTKVALEMVNGLMIHPIVGEIKPGDIPAQTRMDCYQAIISHYYNADRVLLNVLPMAMRYAGPREAVHHAIIRQNYGISHLIIGRDHAGVGNYYGTYDAQLIFDKIDDGALEITPLRFEHAFFCRKCQQMVTAKTCPHDKSEHVFLSGTKVREKLRNNEDLPPEFSRKEVADILKKWALAEGS
jgi:sulfate adenylyltransferase